MKKNISNAKIKMLLGVSSLVLINFMSPSFALAQDKNSKTKATNEEDIIVTATKRSEKLTDVPIAISVVSAQSLSQTGVRELSQLTGFVPNVQVTEHSDFRSAITIRGVGSNSRNIGFDSRVGVYVDGVYMGQSPATNQELLDLARVEVLRGPQGMLFGKNTVAGAISLVTAKPADTFSGQISANVGNYDYRTLKGMVNIPLGDKAAAKFSVSKTLQDGYIKNKITGNMLDDKDVLAYRAQLRFTPNDKFEVNFAYDGLKADNKIIAGKPVSDMLGIAPLAGNIGPEEVAFSFDPSEKRDISGGVLNLEYKLDNGMIIKSITGYRDTDATYRNATDYSPVDVVSIEYNDIFKQTTQEFQLISPRDGKLTYMAGVYFYAQDADTSRDVTLGTSFEEAFIAKAVAPSLAPLLHLDPNNLTPAQLSLISSVAGFGPEGSKIFNRGSVRTESVALYFNGAYNLTERLKLGIGGRYSIESKSVNWLLDGRNSGVFNIGSTNVDLAGVPHPLLNDRSDNFFSPAISLTYKFDNGRNLYAKYSSGYKSGGFNLDYINKTELAANSGLAFNKETVDSYEIGLKGRYFDRRLGLNIAAFQANYNDYQVNQFVDLGGGKTSIRITNAAKVVTKGIEAELNLRVTDNFNIDASIGLLDAKFDKFVGGGSGGTDASGKKLVNAPDLTATLSAVYKRQLPSLNSTLLVRADITHSAGQYTTADNVKTTKLLGGAFVPFGYIDAQTEYNARIGLMSAGEKYQIFLWGKNLSDEKGKIDDFRDFFGTIVYHPRRGRTFGLELTSKF